MKNRYYVLISAIVIFLTFVIKTPYKHTEIDAPKRHQNSLFNIANDKNDNMTDNGLIHIFKNNWNFKAQLFKHGDWSVTRIDSLLNKNECSELITQAEQVKKWKSSIWSLKIPKDMSDQKINDQIVNKRKSKQTPDGIISSSSIDGRLIHLFGSNRYTCSGVVKYGYGDYIKRHSDGSQQTIIIYLNNVDESAGGATCFTTFGKCFQPVIGMALWWSNPHYRSADISMEHYGAEIIKPDTYKYIFTCQS